MTPPSHHRGVAAFLQSRTEPEDLILQQGVDGPLARYYRGGLPLRTYHQGYFSGEAGGHERFRELVAGHPRVWWVGSRLWYEDPDGRVRAWLAGSGEEIAAERFPGVDVRGFRMEAR